MRGGSYPNGKCLYVEVDWMKKDKGKEYKMNEDSQNKVIYSFGKHQILLHIDARYTPTNQRLVCILENKFSTDDGCMGGGESIGHDDYLAFYDTNKKKSGSSFDRKDGIGGNPSKPATRSVEGLWSGKYTDSSGNPYFDLDRKNVFHYCVIGDEASYLRSSGKTPHGRAAMAEYDTATKGDFLAIWGGAMTGKYDCNEWWASMWMHELGHCLALDADGYYNSKGEEISESIYPSCMRYGRDKGDKGFIDYSNVVGSIDVYKTDGTKYSTKFNTNDWSDILDIKYFI